MIDHTMLLIIDHTMLLMIDNTVLLIIHPFSARSVHSPFITFNSVRCHHIRLHNTCNKHTVDTYSNAYIIHIYYMPI